LVGLDASQGEVHVGGCKLIYDNRVVLFVFRKEREADGNRHPEEELAALRSET
jgi:hypothetical protein